MLTLSTVAGLWAMWDGPWLPGAPRGSSGIVTGNGMLQVEQDPGGDDRPPARPVAGRSLLGWSFNPFFAL